jgi:hypothetical protein
MHLRSLRTYLVRLSAQQRFLLLQALLLLLGFVLMVRVFTFERMARWLQLIPYETPPQADRNAELLAAQIRWAITVIARRAPIPVTCLTQALAASWLARRRGLRLTLYLGVMRTPAGELKAHAWSRCGSCVITGKAGRQDFTAIACYSVAGPRPA